ACVAAVTRELAGSGRGAVWRAGARVASTLHGGGASPLATAFFAAHAAPSRLRALLGWRVGGAVGAIGLASVDCLAGGAAVNVPVTSPLEPMLAKRSESLPAGDGWIYEP